MVIRKITYKILTDISRNVILNKLLVKIRKSIYKNNFKLLHKQDYFIKKMSGIKQIMGLIISSILFSTLFGIVLLLIDPIIFPKIKNLIPKFITPIYDDYTTFMLTISSIGALFVGLYYAAISTISISIYSDSPQEIRELLSQERIGNLYLDILSFFTFLGLELVAFSILGFDEIYLAIPIMLLGAALGIFSFTRLGNRVFHLSDPNNLSYKIFELLVKNLKMVSIKNKKWYSKEVQYNSHQMCLSSLKSIQILPELTKKSNRFNGYSYIDFCQKLVRFLCIYEEEKRLIPTYSKWFEEKYKHGNWYKSDSTEVTSAYNLGSMLQPNIIVDEFWIENRLDPIIIDCIKTNIINNNFRDLFSLISEIDRYINYLGRLGKVDKAISLISIISSAVLNSFDPEDTSNKYLLEKLTLIESVSIMPINLIKSFFIKIEKQELESEIEKIRWNRKDDIYKHEFDTYLLDDLEKLYKKISIEVKLHGNVITPLWYIKDQLFCKESKMFERQILAFFNIEIYDSLKKIINHPNLCINATILSRGWQFYKKLSTGLDILEKKWNFLLNFKSLNNDSWNSLDFNDFNLKLNKKKIKLIETLGNYVPVLEENIKNDNLPDFSGQFLHIIGEHCMSALIDCDLEVFDRIIQRYFPGCFMKYNNLKPIAIKNDWVFQNEIMISIGPLLDLIDITGYSILMSDYFDKKELKNSVINLWDNYLDINTKNIDFIIRCAECNDNFLLSNPRSLLRIDWKRRVTEELSSIIRVQKKARGLGFYKTVIQHDSPLVRVFASDRNISYDGIDIFIYYVLLKKNKENNVEFSNKTMSFVSSIEKEISDY